jgi:glutamyl-tRNA reductase
VIAVVGLSHRTAPIAIREFIAIPTDQIEPLLKHVVARSDVAEAMIVSTCNRVELVVASRPGCEANTERLAQEAAAELLERAPAVRGHLYLHAGADAIKHLFRVASSLDSIVVGEPQILGQVKDAFERARAAGTVGPTLHRAVTHAVRAAKRVRTETAVGAGQVSVPSIAVDLAQQIFGSLRGKRAMLVGSGEMAETVARLAHQSGAAITVVGRNMDRVRELATRFEAEPRPWSDLGACLGQADVIISSTSAPAAVIDRRLVSASRRARRGKSTFFIDLAVPRDIDPAVGDIDGVFLYNVDDLSNVVAETLSTRKKEADRAEAIVEDETRGWQRWRDAAHVTPTVVALRQQFRAVLGGELERTLRTRLKHLGAEDRAHLERMLEAGINKLLHEPTVRLRQVATEGGSTDPLVLALEELFVLDADGPPAQSGNRPSLSPDSPSIEPARLETAER